VVAADHGEEFWEHGGLGHGSAVYGEQVNVPLLVHKPNQRRSYTSDRLTSTVDIMPTLGKECGFYTECDGYPLDSDPDREVFCEKTSRGISEQTIIGKQYKYIWFNDEGRGELYDLLADPKERNDLRGTHAQDAAKLHTKMMAHNRKSRAERSKQGEVGYTKKERAKLRALGYLQ